MNILKTLYTNYTAQNTPTLVHKIGNWLLSLGAMGLTIIGLPLLMQQAGIDGFVLPLIAVKGAKILIACGVFGKVITKLFGSSDVTTDAGK